MAEKKKAEERRKKKDHSKGEAEPEAPSPNEKVRKVYRFDDWASI